MAARSNLSIRISIPYSPIEGKQRARWDRIHIIFQFHTVRLKESNVKWAGKVSNHFNSTQSD